MIVVDSVSMETKFNPTYVRNNRSTGQKSLRCFPQCSEQGHRCSGFCGQSIKCDMHLSKTNIGFFDWSRVLVVANINPKNPIFNVSDKILKKDILPRIKVEGSPPGSYDFWYGNPNLLFENELMTTINCEFNGKLRSWDYEWNSNRWRGGDKHVFQIYVLCEVGQVDECCVYEVIATKICQEFEIRSNKKQTKDESRSKRKTKEDSSNNSNLKKNKRNSSPLSIDLNSEENQNFDNTINRSIVLYPEKYKNIKRNKNVNDSLNVITNFEYEEELQLDYNSSPSSINSFYSTASFSFPENDNFKSNTSLATINDSNYFNNNQINHKNDNYNYNNFENEENEVISSNDSLEKQASLLLSLSVSSEYKNYVSNNRIINPCSFIFDINYNIEVIKANNANINLNNFLEIPKKEKESKEQLGFGELNNELEMFLNNKEIKVVNDNNVNNNVNNNVFNNVNFFWDTSHDIL